MSARAEDNPKQLKCARATTQINACSATNCDMAEDKCTEDNEQEVCWICLDGQSPDRQLQRPCKCPRFTHAYCLARWQLQMAGSPKEHFCEFCKGHLPDWKNVLTPVSGCCAPAVMNVNFNGRTYSFEVKPGPDGYRHFTRAIRQAFRLPDDSELNITFTCDEPTAAGSLLTLQGPGAYDAAVHCASVSAARRSSSSGTPSSSSLDGSTRGVSPVALTQIPSIPRTPRAKAFANMGRRLKTALVDLFFLRAEMPPAAQAAAQQVA